MTGVGFEPTTYGLKALCLAGLNWHTHTLTTEDVHQTRPLRERVCTSWYMRVRGSGAQ